jgi:hypothetical protein
LFGFWLTFVFDVVCMLIIAQGCSISKVRALEERWQSRVGPAHPCVQGHYPM